MTITHICPECKEEHVRNRIEGDTFLVFCDARFETEPESDAFTDAWPDIIEDFRATVDVMGKSTLASDVWTKKDVKP